MMDLPKSREARQWVHTLNLKAHPEGGYYREVYRCSKTAEFAEGPDRTSKGVRSLATVIYYLLAGDDFSAWHRLPSDEMWHFYEGTPILIYQIDSGSGNLTVSKLGLCAEADYFPQVLIPAGKWFAAEMENKNGFALMGCTVFPGFEFSDFELASPGQLEALCRCEPRLIQRFMRRPSKTLADKGQA